MKNFKPILSATIIAFISNGMFSLAEAKSGHRSFDNDDAVVEEKRHKSNGNKPHWSYEDSEGPENWADLSPDYHLCKNGKRQSPINITETEQAKLGAIYFNYKAGPKEIVNNGHTIQVNMRKGSYIIVSGKKYKLLQFHFHSPSEHTIDGKPADMVAHFVHRANDGELGVVGVLLKACQENNTISQLWRKFPTTTGKKNKLSRKINVLKMLPKNRGYYNYSGSLTTPPCSEGVNWMVLKNTVPLSDAQVKVFTDTFSKSVRPIQEKNYRVVRSRN